MADPGHGKEASVSRTDRFMVRHQQLMPLPDNLRPVDRRCTAPSIAQWIRAWLTNDRPAMPQTFPHRCGLECRFSANAMCSTRSEGPGPGGLPIKGCSVLVSPKKNYSGDQWDGQC